MTPIAGKQGSYFYNAPQGIKKPAGIFVTTNSSGNEHRLGGGQTAVEIS